MKRIMILIILFLAGCASIPEDSCILSFDAVDRALACRVQQKQLRALGVWAPLADCE